MAIRRFEAEGLMTLQDSVRAVHRAFPSGVAVVTTAVDGRPYGLAVNAFSSVSMDPPLVLVCVNTSARTHDHLYDGEHMGISFLAHDQAEIARTFASSGGEKFVAVAWRPGVTGAPLLDDTSAHLEVRVRSRLPAGTHTIFISEVVDAQKAEGRAPLVYHDAAFFDGAQLTPVT